MSDAATDWGEVESPCIGICKLDSSGVYCTGCLRTRAEIGAWSTASRTEKLAIIARVSSRKKAQTSR